MYLANEATERIKSHEKLTTYTGCLAIRTCVRHYRRMALWRPRRSRTADSGHWALKGKGKYKRQFIASHAPLFCNISSRVFCPAFLTTNPTFFLERRISFISSSFKIDSRIGGLSFRDWICKAPNAPSRYYWEEAKIIGRSKIEWENSRRKRNKEIKLTHLQNLVKNLFLGEPQLFLHCHLILTRLKRCHLQNVKAHPVCEWVKIISPSSRTFLKRRENGVRQNTFHHLLLRMKANPIIVYCG